MDHTLRIVTMQNLSPQPGGDRANSTISMLVLWLAIGGPLAASDLVLTRAVSTLQANGTSNLTARLAGKTTNDLVIVTPAYVDDINNTSNPGWQGDVSLTNWTFSTTSAWAGMRGLSGILVWNTTGHDHGGATLVSPRHYICCNHGGHPIGTTLYFVSTNGSMVSAVVTNHANLDPNWAVNDCQIGILAPAITNCEIVRCLPPAGFYHLPQSSVALLAISHYRSLFAHAGKINIAGGVGISRSLIFTNATRYGGISGDSGGGIFMPVGDELVFVSSFTTGSGANWSVVQYWAEINAAMSNLSVSVSAPVYQLTPVDLSAFLK